MKQYFRLYPFIHRLFACRFSLCRFFDRVRFVCLPVRALIYTAAFLFFVFPSFALSVPALDTPVNDYARLLSTEEKENLVRYLGELNRKTGIQIAVLTVTGLEGEDIESFSIKAAEKWKLGQQGKDNGAFIVVALKEHKVRIEVGYGLESTLTDAQCGLIIRNIIAPAFRNGEYGKGIIGAIQTMVNLAAKSEGFSIDENDDILASGIETDESEEAGKTASILFFLIMLMLSLIYGHARRRSFAHDPYGARRMVRGVAAASLLSSFLRSSSGRFSGGFDDFKGGGSSGSGFGGFSGGGGGFGGGGASGSW